MFALDNKWILIMDTMRVFDGMNSISQEKLERVYAKVNAYNKAKEGNGCESCYEIWVTGRRSVYYTLWKYSETGATYVSDNMHDGTLHREGSKIISYRYKGNLSKDVEEAVDKTIAIIGDGKETIRLYAEETKKFKFLHKDYHTLNFGKYAGMTIEEVAGKDIKYVMWLKDALEGDKAYATLRKPFPEKKQCLLDDCNNEIEAYYNRVTEENRNKSVSTYVGNEGDKISVQLTIKSVKISYADSDDSAYETIIAVDENNNNFKIYVSRLTSNWNAVKTDGIYVPTRKAGDVLNVRGTIRKHEEKLGVKYTALTRVKF